MKATGKNPSEAKPHNSADHIRAWLRFAYSSLTPSQQRLLYLEKKFDPATLFRRADNYGRYPLPYKLIADVDENAVEKDLQWSEGDDCHLLALDDSRYPSLLKAIYDPPWILYVKGDADCLQSDFIAIVGSRNPTPGGRVIAEDFAHILGVSGWGIVSGLATGIDGAAHQGALRARTSTVAVLGTGPDQIYPRHHRTLAQEVSCSGALISEFPPATPARPYHFPRRNRIISGLSHAVLVVEASLRSGSLITARLAADQGREVCAVPGSIHSPTARGCHRLIRQGAKLVECAQDILEELGHTTSKPAFAEEIDAGLSPTNGFNTLLSQMGHDPVAMDELIHRSGLTTDSVSSMLLRMELQGLVATLPGGRYQRLK